MFFPKEKKFFNLFELQAEKIVEAINLIKELEKNPQRINGISMRMKKIEEEADEVGHKIIDDLHQSFITPIEREDIDILRQNLDEIMDKIERAVNRLAIFKVPLSPFPEDLLRYFEIIEEAVLEIKEGLKEIRNLKKFSKSLRGRCQRINRLENEGDDLNRRALEKLMNPPEETWPQKNLEIMKRKEIYETLEDAVDRCEDVANVFESILIKNM